jgi:hypothetical protein
MTEDTERSIVWIVVFSITIAMMEIFGTKVGIAIFVAQLAHMGWDARKR